MTNKEDEENEKQFDPDMIALLAFHLVSQVLDKAYVIANCAKDAGKSWRSFTIFKDIGDNEMGETLGDISNVSKDNNNFNKIIIDGVANVITSTPQKLTDDKKFQIESTYIGQGDEELETGSDEISDSTSIFIQGLFDMSEVERTFLRDNGDTMPKDTKSKDLLTQTINTEPINQLVDSYINTACSLTSEQFPEPINILTVISSSDNERSEFSFLNDADTINICKGEGSRDTENYFKPESNISEATELPEQHLKESVSSIKPEETTLNEDVYLTLNRDYEQYSEGDADLVLQDPKGLTLHEVELLTANTSDENMMKIIKPQQEKKSSECLAAKMISAGTSRKFPLIRRCRNRGARLLSCFRSWWPFKANKSKESFGIVHGRCPLSPDARRRASCSLDQRLLRSTPLNSDTWKFNTVNEVIVNSTRWKDYTLENRTDDGLDEY